MKNQNLKRSSAIALSALLVLGITEATSYASSVTATAQMTWASLTITGTGSVTGYNPGETWTSSESHAGTSNQWTIPSTYDVNDFDYGIVATIAESEIGASLPHSAYALAKTDTVSGQRNIIATASAFATNYEEYSAIATAQRDRYYQVTGSGSLIFSINYTLDDITIDASDGYGWADILAFTNLTRYNATTGKWVNIPAGFVTKEKVSGLIDFDGYIYGPKSGTITFTYAATAGQYLHFGAGVKAKASAQSAVPVPGAVWLLGSGLLGMIAIRRKSAK